MNTPTVNLEPSGLRIVWDLDGREIIFHIYSELERLIFQCVSGDGVDIYHEVDVSTDAYYSDEEQDKIDQINEALNLLKQQLEQQ